MTQAFAATISQRPTSLWLQQSLSREFTQCPPFSGTGRADVAVVGGGYVGLWTAIEIKKRDPATDVMVLEQDICGSGASGRNGGYVLSWWPRAASLRQRWGATTTADMIKRTETAIQELQIFCRTEQIDAQFTRCGWVWGAASDHQSGGWDAAVDACTELGVGDFQELDRESAQSLIGTNVFRSAILDKTAALSHPGHLVRGMREVAIKKGVRIHEQTSVTTFSRSCPVVLTTNQGKVTADTVVLATNAWAANVPELARSIVVVSSDMIATPPIPDRLKSANWRNGPGVNDSRQMVNYVRTTFDGRVLAGKGGLGTAYGGRIGNPLFQSSKRAAVVRQNFVTLYPQFADVDTSCSWSGPVDRSADGLPMLGRLPKHENILFGIGWSGNGLGPSRIGGRVLACLAMRERNEWTELPIVGAPRQDLPGEPVRFLGSHLVRSAVARKDEAEVNNRSPNAIVNAVAALAPRGVEDQ